MKNILTLYDDSNREILYFCDEKRITYIHGDSAVDYEEYELHKCYVHIMTTINNKQYADCVCECISALVNDWFEDYIQMSGYNDIKNHILDMNDINIYNMKSDI